MRRRERNPLLIAVLIVILFCLGVYLTTTDWGTETPEPSLRIEFSVSPTP